MDVAVDTVGACNCISRATFSVPVTVDGIQ